MSWLQLSINTTHESVDWVRTLLSTTTYAGDMQVVPYSREDIIDHDEPQANWAFTVHLYLPNTISTNHQLDEIYRRLSGLERVREISILDAIDVETKVDYAHTINSSIHRIGQRFVIVSPDTTYEAETSDQICIKLPESLAFGSGLHPATILSLQLVEQYTRPSMSGLDLGSGSGILSVAMAKLGANVLALDNDPVAVRSTQDAVNLNQVNHQVTVMEGSLGAGNELGHWMGGETTDNGTLIQPAGRFDIVVANILARIHIALAQDFQQALQQSSDRPALLITSGFTTDYKDEVTNALTQAGFELIACKQMDEWVAIAYQLKHA
ncbi:MAG TPA: 50S ribosomal protein L11 methyltransferase [Crinalium sp.]